MSFNEYDENKNTLFNLEQKIKEKRKELIDIENEIDEGKSALNKILLEITDKKLKFEELVKQLAHLNDFINMMLYENFPEDDYSVNIENCYIISLDGKKYIALKTTESIGGTYSRRYGYCTNNRCIFKDALSFDEKGNFVVLCKYSYKTYSHKPYFDSSKPVFQQSFIGEVPESQQPILKVRPELSLFVDGCVPSTYLKKIYYEINDLGNKKLIR